MKKQELNKIFENKETKEHSKISASWAAIWLNCLGAVKLSSQYPEIDTGDEYAQEGTKAHWLAEQVLTGKMRVHEIPNEYKELILYINKVKELQKDGVLLCEVKVDMTEVLKSQETLKGTADAVIIHQNNAIEIIDLKWGQGVKVSAWKNPQLSLYAIGVIKFLADSGLLDTLNLEDKITLHIIQPRIETPHSFYELTIGELVGFGEFVRTQLSKIYNGSNDLTQGDHCQFCKGKVYCPLFLNTTHNIVLESKKELKEFEDNKLIEIFKRRKDVNAFYLALEKYIKAQISLSPNKEFMGYTIKEVKGDREIVDEEALIDQFIQAGAKREELQDVSIIGFTKLDALAKRLKIPKENIAGVGFKKRETLVEIETANIFKEE